MHHRPLFLLKLFYLVQHHPRRQLLAQAPQLPHQLIILRIPIVDAKLPVDLHDRHALADIRRHRLYLVDIFQAVFDRIDDELLHILRRRTGIDHRDQIHGDVDTRIFEARHGEVIHHAHQREDTDDNQYKSGIFNRPSWELHSVELS